MNPVRREVAILGRRAFTMVEVAISLAIIGFALVAIIGILPAGLNVQRENREETIINQEVSIWMDAIRSGAEGMDYLTGYVDAVEIEITEYDDDGNFVQTLPTAWYTYLDSSPPGFPLANGGQIVGLLTTPQFILGGSGVYSNHVVAYVRSISGAATEKLPQDNPTVRESAFSYRLTSEVVPFIAYNDHWTNQFSFQKALSSGVIKDPAEVEKMDLLSKNLHDVSLVFQWPLRPPYDFTSIPPILPTKVGNSRQSFRTMVGGAIRTEANDYFFVQPGVFEREQEP